MRPSSFALLAALALAGVSVVTPVASAVPICVGPICLHVQTTITVLRHHVCAMTGELCHGGTCVDVDDLVWLFCHPPP